MPSNWPGTPRGATNIHTAGNVLRYWVSKHTHSTPSKSNQTQLDLSNRSILIPTSGALINGVFLLALCFSIFLEAIQRVFDPISEQLQLKSNQSVVFFL
jgi:hypothetical protein